MNPKSIDVEPGYVYLDETEQIRGSLYGFFVGDASGVPVEFVGRTTLKNNPIKGMEEYGTHNQPKGTWSDDSLWYWQQLIVCIIIKKFLKKMKYLIMMI